MVRCPHSKKRVQLILLYPKPIMFNHLTQLHFGRASSSSVHFNQCVDHLWGIGIRVCQIKLKVKSKGEATEKGQRVAFGWVLTGERVDAGREAVVHTSSYPPRSFHLAATAGLLLDHPALHSSSTSCSSWWTCLWLRRLRRSWRETGGRGRSKTFFLKGSKEEGLPSQTGSQCFKSIEGPKMHHVM